MPRIAKKYVRKPRTYRRRTTVSGRGAYHKSRARDYYSKYRAYRDAEKANSKVAVADDRPIGEKNWWFFRWYGSKSYQGYNWFLEIILFRIMKSKVIFYLNRMVLLPLLITVRSL